MPANSTAMNASPSSRRSVSKRVPVALSAAYRRPSTGQPAAARRFTASRSTGERPRSAPRPLPTANGRLGWATTGATTDGSTIIASAKPPVKHMPTAPDAGTAGSRVQLAGQRPQPVGDRAGLAGGQLGELLADADLRRSALARLPGPIAASGSPNRCGSTTVCPRATTSSANAITSGVIPGISWMTITPVPEPLRVRRVGDAVGGVLTAGPGGEEAHAAHHAVAVGVPTWSALTGPP